MKGVTAEVVTADQAWPGARRLVLRAPGLVQEAAAGQFVAVTCADDPAGGVPLLRRPLWIAGLSRATGDLVLIYTVRGRGTIWLAGRPAGAQLSLLGPAGKPFVVDDKTRRALLIGCDIAGLAPLLCLAAGLAARGLGVTLLAGAATASSLPPATVLHPEVEYHVATADGSAGRHGDVLDLVPAYLSWADQIYASLAAPHYEPLLALIRRDRMRPGAGFAQALLWGTDTALPCAVGACDGCTVRTRDGYRRLCRDGAVFDLPELVG